MLSNNHNTTSSIQRRRQLHRRQNSLEVPILATSIPAHHRRTQRQHRRGLSLDQSTTYSASGRLTPLQEQEPMVSTTNSGHSTPQHIMQEAQQQRPAQPGLQDMDQQFLHQLQHQNAQLQQLQQQQMMPQHAIGQDIAPPEQAIQSLNDHIRSFYATYGHMMSGGDPSHPNIVAIAPPTLPQMTPTTIMAQTQRPCTPVSQYFSTPHATPQTGRPMSGHCSERAFDCSPMPGGYPNVPIVTVEHTSPPKASVYGEHFSEFGAGSSSYQSSIVDPSSPCRSPAKQQSAMPTLYEEASSPASSHIPLTHEQLLLHAAQGGQDLGIYFDDSPARPPMSPREMFLANNPEVDASLEDTGISVEDVQRYISSQEPSDNKWTCLYPDCGKKFGRKENIKSHVQTHLGDRQFKCNHCGKCFVRQHDLKRHAKIHSGNKPHRCPCGNGFARQDALTRHRQRGVCEGALPGFERREVKRGRPRKVRPDIEERMDKASRARKLDARRGSEAGNTYASSVSDDRSYPNTPPHSDCHTFDGTEDVLLDYSGDSELDAFLQQYRDTPPTSPVTAADSPNNTQQSFNNVPTTASFDFATGVSPAALSNHSSPPASSHPSPADLAPQHNDNDAGFGAFDFGVDTQPVLAADPFSPTPGSTSSVSEYEQTFESQGGLQGGMGLGKETFMGSQGLELDFSQSMNTGEAFFEASLDAWLQTH